MSKRTSSVSFDVAERTSERICFFPPLPLSMSEMRLKTQQKLYRKSVGEQTVEQCPRFMLAISSQGAERQAATEALHAAITAGVESGTAIYLDPT